jgi:hypothetical protein
MSLLLHSLLPINGGQLRHLKCRINVIFGAEKLKGADLIQLSNGLKGSSATPPRTIRMHLHH